jgi:transposase-like protein
MRTRERAEAIRLRRDEGRSVREIATLLGVARSSVSRWVRDVELSYEQRAALASRNPALNPEFNGSRMQAQRALETRRRYQEAGRALARRGEPLFVAGCMLYWGEGAKSRNQLMFANSDPDMAALFMRFLRTYFDVRDDAVRVTCHLFADHIRRQRELERFWLETLDLPPERLGKSLVNTYSRSSKRLRRNVLPYGTCRIVVSRVAVVQAIYGALQEFGGFERPQWAEN